MTAASPWPLSEWAPVIDLGYPYTAGPEFLYDQALYDTAGLYGPWWEWVDVACQTRSFDIVRGAPSPGVRPQSGTATLLLADPDGDLAPWRIDPATGERLNRANIPLRIGILPAQGGPVSWLFTGWVDTWADADERNDPVVAITASDGFKHLALADGPEQTPTGAGDGPGGRIDRVLTHHGWVGPTDIASPSNPPTLQATTLAQSALVELFLTVDTVAGVLYVAADGTLTFRDRAWLAAQGATVSWQLSDGVDPGVPCASAITVTADDIDVANIVGISNIGGTAQWVSDDDSIAAYGPRSWSRFDLPHEDPLWSAQLAAIHLADRTANDFYASSVVLVPQAEPDLWPVVAGADLTDTVRITRRRGGQTLDLLAAVIGVTHSATPTELVTTLTLGPRIRQAFDRYDDPSSLYDSARYSAV